MWQSKSDVYRTEWLDLVFDNRNKSYGAYELRRHNGQTSMKAFFALSVLVCSSVGVWLGFFRLQERVTPVMPPSPPGIPVYLDPVIQQPRPPVNNPAEVQQPSAPKPAGVKPLNKISFHVVPANVVEDPFFTIPELPGENVLENAGGTGGSLSGEGASGSGEAGSPGKATGSELVGFEFLEKYPEFPGGQRAFAKYLSRNLRYPNAAVDANITGSVVLSFIIEKDGKLSDVRVLRGIGGGCDQEAVRVLEKAPAWSPGMQNGKPVRVAYTVPIYFSLQN